MGTSHYLVDPETLEAFDFGKALLTTPLLDDVKLSSGAPFWNASRLVFGAWDGLRSELEVFAFGTCCSRLALFIDGRLPRLQVWTDHDEAHVQLMLVGSLFGDDYTDGTFVPPWKPDGEDDELCTREQALDFGRRMRGWR